MNELVTVDDSNTLLQIPLGKNRCVYFVKYHNRLWIHIRQYYENCGILMPGFRGVSLNIQEWKMLKENLDLIGENRKDITYSKISDCE